MIHFTSRQIVSDLVQSCHQITLSHLKTYRINCHFYESFHFMTIHSTCVVFLVVTAAHTNAKVFISHIVMPNSILLLRTFANTTDMIYSFLYIFVLIGTYPLRFYFYTACIALIKHAILLTCMQWPKYISVLNSNSYSKTFVVLKVVLIFWSILMFFYELKSWVIVENLK